MQQGDLVYIPQAVDLHVNNGAGSHISRTKKPSIALLVKEQGSLYEVFINGRNVLVKKDHVYPVEKENKC
jgi:IS1 family transposase